jgi:hypothetical protein
MTDKQPYRVICADGSPHRDYGVGPISEAVSERAARDAADFMDDERDSSPWECGPHSVAPSAPSAGVSDA